MQPGPGAAPRDDLAAERGRMVDEQLAARAIHDARVLAAMRQVPRHELVPPDQRAFGYDDRPLPIGHDQTISQPYVVAAMTAAARVAPGARVLDVGTGSGYQAAVLVELGADVYSIEIVPELAAAAAAALARLGYAGDRLHFRVGDGYRGWPEAAPFDAIIVAAATAVVPPPLLAQLAVGGRLVLPVGDERQELQVITRHARDATTSRLFPVRFVPMTGEARRSAP